MGEVEQRKLFVGGLSQDTTEDSLKSYFGGFGDLEDCSLKFDNDTQRSKCFGFVTFVNDSSVAEVLKMGSHNIDGKNIDPKRATKKKTFEQPRIKKVFVGGTGDISKESMESHFVQYGQIHEIVFPVVPETQKRRGFAFVEFVNADSVTQAVAEEDQWVDNIVVAEDDLAVVVEDDLVVVDIKEAAVVDIKEAEDMEVVADTAAAAVDTKEEEAAVMVEVITMEVDTTEVVEEDMAAVDMEAAAVVVVVDTEAAVDMAAEITIKVVVEEEDMARLEVDEEAVVEATILMEDKIWNLYKVLCDKPVGRLLPKEWTFQNATLLLLDRKKTFFRKKPTCSLEIVPIDCPAILGIVFEHFQMENLCLYLR